MKLAIIRSTWMDRYGYRLDCQPYAGGALEMKILLERLPLHKDKLSDVTSAIFHAGRESRNWVESEEYGVPFLGAGQLQRADLSALPLISKRQVQSTPLFVVRKGWTLITRSGTIGKMAFCRPDMDGLAVSEDVLRVVPNPAKISSGYLYTYLGSKFGIPLVASGTYGAIIQHLEPQHITDLPVPRLGDALEDEIHTLVEEAAELRVQATKRIAAAREQLLRAFGKPPTPQIGTRHRNWAGHKICLERLRRVGRFDAFFYNPVASELDEWIAHHSAGSVSLHEIADVFDVPPFKHIYVEPGEGIGFFTSADIFLLDKKPDKHLSPSQTKALRRYVLEAGWVLLARSGSLGGNIAKPQFADSSMVGTTASDHVIRIAPKSDRFSAGYLYTYLSLRELGYPLLLRTATGACIPALWPLYLNDLRVLRPSVELNAQTDVQIREALEMRVRATGIEDEARQRLETAVAESGS